MRHPLRLLPLLCLATACGRDFTLPEPLGQTGSGPAILDLTVSPDPAPRGTVEIRFRVDDPLSEPPQVTVLGAAVPSVEDAGPGGIHRHVYDVTGDEPEGSPVAVQVTAQNDAGVRTRNATVVFDFTRPGLVAVRGRAAPETLDATGEIFLRLDTDEPLAVLPEVTLAGGPVPCAATADETRFLCLRPVTAADPDGWQTAAIALRDRAGNEAFIDGAETGVAIDRGGPAVLTFGPVMPSLATIGDALEIPLQADRPLEAPPAVVIGACTPACEATHVGGPDLAGRWQLRYEVTGDEREGQGPVTLRASATSGSGTAAQAETSAELDFQPPGVDRIQASATAVAVGQEIVLTITADEPIVSLAATVQGLPLRCTADAPATWACAYTATGLETEGPQLVVVQMRDRVGLESVILQQAGFAFDFRCELDASRTRLVRTYDAPPEFAAEAGAFEPYAAVALLTRADGASLTTVTAAGDGSVASVTLDGFDRAMLFVAARDTLGHTCAVQAATTRFRVDLASVPDGENPSSAHARALGTPVPDLLLFEGAAGLDPADYRRLAPDDGQGVSASGEPAPVAGWSEVPLTWTHQAPGEALTWDPSRRAVMTYVGSASTGDSFWWEGTQWSHTAGYGSATEGGFRMAYQRHRGRMFFFGGRTRNMEPLGGTWEWDGFEWIARSPDLEPGPRWLHGTTYDPVRRRIIVYGGNDEATVALADTWEWDGEQWARRAEVSPPGRRRGAPLVYDPVRNVTWLFGGYDSATSQALGDVWSWDGATWQQIEAVGGPGPRYLHSAIWNPASGTMLVYGGRDGNGALVGDLWEWNGRTWKPGPDLTGGPAPRHSAGLAHDPVRGTLVVYGGFHGGLFRSDLWELPLGRRWPTFHASFVVPDPGVLAPSALTVEVSAEGRAGTLPVGYEVHVWDHTAFTWVHADRFLPGEPADGRVVLDADLDRFLANGTVEILLLPLRDATRLVGTTLSVDHLAVSIDY